MKKSNILAHRGIWQNSSEKNSKISLFKALEVSIKIESNLFILDLVNTF